MNKKVPKPITADDGPFLYSYIAVMGVPGIRLNEEAEDIHLFSFSKLNATAILTQDWDRYCQHIDRSAAISILMLTGFHGHARFKRLSSWTNSLLRHLLGAAKFFEWNLVREERKARLTRLEVHRSPGCYLVYCAEGQLLESPQFQFTRRAGCIGCGFDIIDGESYRSIHRAALHGVATALSLVIDKGTGSPEINDIGDIVYLTGSDGLTIYSKRIEMGAVGMVTSKPPTTDELNQLTQHIPLIAADSRIGTAIFLFVQSHRKDSDNLRAFITAWSALELLVNHLARIVRPEWEKLLCIGKLPNWDRNLIDVSPQDYRMRDRFYSVACTLKLEDAAEDSKKFNQSNDRRSGYYHRNDVKERDLPTNNVRLLFRKYLALALSYAKRNDDVI